jgi:LacI family transcriptional regulator
MRKICLFTSPFPFMQSINQGIAACSKRIGPWRIEMQFFARDESVVQFVQSRKYDGVIVTYFASFCEQLREAGVPLVSAQATDNGVPFVTNDDRAIGVMGAKHLLDCGYKRFAFYGGNEAWSRNRFEGFKSELETRGLQSPPLVDSTRTDSATGVSEVSDSVVRFLKSLDGPTAIMASNDHAARLLLDYAIEGGVRVPGDLAVLGVDNDELLCETGACPLSSIDTDLFRVGFEAALMLDRMIRGVKSAASVPPVPPKTVARRQSTSLFAHDDPDVASALRYIYERAGEGITVADVCRHVCLSRRRLEQRFLSAVGRSPGDEIRQLRIDRAKALLTETNMTLAEIASRCGYAFTSGFSSAFRDVVGTSPGEYRRTHGS